MRRRLHALSAAVAVLALGTAGPALADGNVATGAIGAVQLGQTAAAPEAAVATHGEPDAAAVPVAVADTGGNTASGTVGTVQAGGGNTSTATAAAVQAAPVAAAPATSAAAAASAPVRVAAA